ncbi:hypothetical protein Lesp02_49000 [Lentzea sp. NBRC 105346]|uniref:hypothetical protein n=1 Tax=Lentzea sp. NBRC 105346 TaxID=3032205 RepID=UPI0024A34A69|nr:hypothetical protein [Lentzea sp. NBRC 105346]GLZ32712.1 hypothetical protein Lesp02_49000 [Lentzea sp. NBRC 105346]
MSVPGGIEDHPDLRDEKWIKQATKRAKREIRRERRRSRLRARSGLIVFVVALLVVGAVLFGLYRAGELKFESAAPPATTTSATPVKPFIGVDLEHPFRTTLVESWAEGGAGLQPTDPNPEFATAYDQVRQFIITAYTDKRVLEAHDPEPIAALLAPSQRDWVHATVGKGSLGIRIAQGQRLLPVAPRSKGTMTATRTAPGEITVKADFTFSYAFHTDAPQSLTYQREIIASSRHEMTMVLLDGQGMRVKAISGFTFGMACKASQEGYLAPSFSEPRLNTGGSDHSDAVDPAKPMPTEGNCPDK